MKIGKKTAVAKEITRQERNRKNNLKRLTISAIVAFILFICLTVIQSSILNQEEKKAVYKVVSDIPVGTKLTEENISTYIGVKEVQLSLIPEGYITDANQVIGKFVNRDYKANDVITIDGVTDTEKLYRDSIENPTEITFSVGGLDSGVAGTVREGDYVNIYGIRGKKESNEEILAVDNKYTFKHVYIAKAFNGGGDRILTPEDVKSEDGSTITTSMFSIVINEKDVDLFYEMLENCEIKLAKIQYDTEKDYQDFLTETNKEAAKATVSTSNETIENYNPNFSGAVENNTVNGNANVGPIGEYQVNTDWLYSVTNNEETEAESSEATETEAESSEATETEAESSKAEETVENSEATETESIAVEENTVPLQ